MRKAKELRGYQQRIHEICGCAPEQAVAIEEIMRSEVFHSTLDWQTHEQFREGALVAYGMLQSQREYHD